jgi:hypothetical protein
MHRLLRTITDRDFTCVLITGHRDTIPDTDRRDITREGTTQDTDLQVITPVGTIPDTGHLVTTREGTIPDTGLLVITPAGTTLDTDHRDIIRARMEETVFTLRHFPEGDVKRIRVQNLVQVQEISMATGTVAEMEEVFTDVSPHICA